MARLLHSVVEQARPCSYLPIPLASLEHRVMMEVLPEEAERLLDRGWRHFGPDWFRPACAACDACVPTRVNADQFVPNRSQRRVHRHLSNLRVQIDYPIVDQARLDLFQAWHNERQSKRGWEPASLDADDYFMQFAFPTPIAREVTYYDPADGDRLVMVAICDETPRAWNAVFCFYHPAYARTSPGTVNILNLVQLAQATGRPYLHLGYRVSACPSLRYKSAFQPQEVLTGRPSDDDEPRWGR
jgi:arginine-tRNA-protein transferase